MYAVTVNRGFCPPVFDEYFELGQMAAKQGEVRFAPVEIQHGYAGSCWFAGFDSMKEVK